MSKVTSKLQVTVPKAIAERYGIRPGDEIEWVAAGDMIRVVPPAAPRVADDRRARLKLFDQATDRQRQRQGKRRRRAVPAKRGWTRAQLYERGSAR